MLQDHIWNAHCLLYVPGAVFFTNMDLEQIYLKIYFKIINDLDHKSRPESQKSRCEHR